MWLTSTNPEELYPILAPHATAFGFAANPSDLPANLRRPFQLYGCACARMACELLTNDALSGIAARERYADGRAGDAEVWAARVRLPALAMSAGQYAVESAARATGTPDGPRDDLWEPFIAARSAAKALAARAAGPAPLSNRLLARWQEAWNTTFGAARAHQCELLRDIFPPPGYAPLIRPDWRTSTAVALARQMDATGDFSAVPILADALQDAGCDDDVMLARCRVESGVHCRGNWVVDLVLGRE